jgi:YVTN family beta-propeller protein
VSNWAASSVSVIDTETRTVRGSVKVGDHPCALALSPDGTQLYVANANSDTVSVIDTRTDGVVQTISLQPYPNAPAGSAPNALAVSPDGKTLYVANAGNNDVAVVDVSGTTPKVVGLIPVGWYPTGVEVSRDGKMIYALSAKGLGAGPNPLYGVAGSPVRQYIGSMVRGILSAIPNPDEATLSRYTKQVIANNGFDERRAERTIEAKPTAIPRRVGDPSPIKHVIYIIKENRTYDQVLGDMPQGNGDPSLVLFGREVTPNHHAIAEEFVLLDNFYVDGSVSEDGHPWSCAAVATDAVEKAFPSNYGGRRPQWDGVVRHPTAGYIWDFCARKGLTYRSYGEMARRTSEGRDVATTGLKGHFCPDFAPKDNNQPADMQRADVFLREFKEFEQNNNLPNFIIMSLPANHTRGTAPGAFTPKAMVADNDLALGRIVDAVSHSKYWKETAIFVVEDDAQNGPDHVDAHRTVALVISPYVKRRFVDSTMYDTVAMLRTMELILGLPPMTQFDAAAAPMMTCFTNKPNLKPYTVRDALISLIEKNKPTAYGAQESLAMNFDEIDEAPWDDLNRILWHSIKGEDVPMPKPKSKRRVLGMWGVQ